MSSGFYLPKWAFWVGFASKVAHSDGRTAYVVLGEVRRNNRQIM